VISVVFWHTGQERLARTAALYNTGDTKNAFMNRLFDQTPTSRVRFQARTFVGTRQPRVQTLNDDKTRANRSPRAIDRITRRATFAARRRKATFAPRQLFGWLARRQLRRYPSGAAAEGRLGRAPSSGFPRESQACLKIDHAHSSVVCACNWNRQRSDSGSRLWWNATDNRLIKRL